MLKHCPECGTKLKEEDKFCPNCGAAIGKESPSYASKSGALTAAGILAIIAACLYIFVIIVCISIMMYSAAYGLILAILSFFGFTFGLTSGILTLKRRYFYLVISGLVIMILSTILISVGPRVSTAEFFYFPGIWILIFAIMSIIFTVGSHKDFVS